MAIRRRNNKMEWYKLLSIILGGGGFLSLVIGIYTARAKKTTIEIENFKKLFDESQEERENIRKQHLDYMAQTDAKIDRLERKVDYMDKRNAIKMRAINSAYRCKLPEKTEDCPVLKTLSKESEVEQCNNN